MAVMHVRQTLVVSERRTCRVIGQHRSTQRKRPQGKVDEELLTADIISLPENMAAMVIVGLRLC